MNAGEVAIEEVVQALIAAAPPITPAERERLAKAWRASGSELQIGKAKTA